MGFLWQRHQCCGFTLPKMESLRCSARRKFCSRLGMARTGFAGGGPWTNRAISRRGTLRREQQRLRLDGALVTGPSVCWQMNLPGIGRAECGCVRVAERWHTQHSDVADRDANLLPRRAVVPPFGAGAWRSRNSRGAAAARGPGGRASYVFETL